jgi:selenocysteine lyase/cysteine desulfurase
MMREALMCIPNVEIKDLGTERAAIVTFTVQGVDASDVKARLASRRRFANSMTMRALTGSGWVS